MFLNVDMHVEVVQHITVWAYVQLLIADHVRAMMVYIPMLPGSKHHAESWFRVWLQSVRIVHT